MDYLFYVEESLVKTSVALNINDCEYLLNINSCLRDVLGCGAKRQVLTLGVYYADSNLDGEGDGSSTML